MPLLTAGRNLCDARYNPCRRIHGVRCARCEAVAWLTETDWYLIRFYQSVQDQYINQTPMGAGKDNPLILTPRIEAYEVALRAYGYPRELWAWLLHWGQALHRLHRKLDEVRWYDETGKSLTEIRPEDVTDGDRQG